MSNWYDDKPRKRSKEEAAVAALNSLTALQLQCSGYDTGRYEISREICSLLSRLIENEMQQAGCRRALKLPSYAYTISPENFLPQFPHVSFCGADERGNIRFDCTFRDAETVTGAKHLNFSDWWNEAVIVEGGGGMENLFPADGVAAIPFDKRRRLRRREVVKLIRNKLGAHYDTSESEGVRFMMKWGRGIAFSFTDVDGVLVNSRKNPERFKYLNSHGDSIIRSIAEEILRSNAKEVLLAVGA